jgi:hypothetical protein
MSDEDDDDDTDDDDDDGMLVDKDVSLDPTEFLKIMRQTLGN